MAQTCYKTLPGGCGKPEKDACFEKCLFAFGTKLIRSKCNRGTCICVLKSCSK